jgi:mannose-1-phosphate guanylyltransferase
MQALILVGGEGTRLRPLTLTVPKPVLPLIDRPFIGYMVDWLARHGVDDVVMACGFLAAGVRDVLGEGGAGGPRLRYVEEPAAMGTAGAIKFAERFLDDRFLALNGDVLTDLDLTALIDQHERHGARATLALYPVEDPSAYGLVRRAADGEIREFLEKPDPDQIDTDEINAGAYVLERDVLDLVPAGREVSIEREVFPKLVGEGLYSLRLEGYWMDIGTPQRYLQASWDLLEGRVESELEARLDESGVHLAADAVVGPGAEIRPPAFVDERTRIGSGSRIGGRAMIGEACAIGDHVVIEGSVIHRSCRIGDRAELRGAILAAGVEIGDRVVVEESAVIGEGARIAAGGRVGPGARVQPGERA